MEGDHIIGIRDSCDYLASGYTGVYLASDDMEGDHIIGIRDSCDYLASGYTGVYLASDDMEGDHIIGIRESCDYLASEYTGVYLASGSLATPWEPLLAGSHKNSNSMRPPGISPTCPRHGRAALAMQNSRGNSLTAAQAPTLEEIQV
ncbi:unnamed protein product [Caenorhabditis nigoni]